MISVAVTKDVDNDDNYDKLCRSDTGEVLHPVFSQLMEASHMNSSFNRNYTLKDFDQRTLGFPPVNVVTHHMRWGTHDGDLRKDEHTYQTTFDRISDLCETRELNPIDVLGLSMTAANEMVKHERTFNRGIRPNPFDYDNYHKDYRYTELKSTLTSAGFAYTEIVPKESTPNPDDDSMSMTIADKYGGTIPKARKLDNTVDRVCVKTTRWIVKKHAHVSPSITVDRKLNEVK